MGKSRQNRVRSHRADPIVKTVKPPTDPELIALRTSSILPVLEDLRKPDPKSRTAAAVAIANIVQNEKCRKLLLREQVVPLVLTETLADSSIESRAAGWEILKFLALHENSDFCVHLFRLDVLTAIDHAAKVSLGTLTAAEPAFPRLPEAQKRVTWNLVTSLVQLLEVLSAARDEILDAILRAHTITRFLFHVAVLAHTPQEVAERTLSCLLTLSEDNLQLGKAIVDDQETKLYDFLFKTASGTSHKAVLACGVLHNTFSSLQWTDNSPGKKRASDAILIPWLSEILDHAISNSGVAVDGQSSDSAETAQVALEVLASIGTGLQSALEMGHRPQAQVTAEHGEWNGFDHDGAATVNADAMDVDSDGEEIEADCDAQDDDSDMDDLQEEMGRVTEKGGAGDESSLLDAPTFQGLVKYAVPRIIQIFRSTSESEGHEGLVVQGLALDALNNMSWSISCVDHLADENAAFVRTWAPAARKIWSTVITPTLDSDSADLSLATRVTGLAWALSRSLGGNTPLKGDEHRKFLSLYHAAKGMESTEDPDTVTSGLLDPFQSLTVKCIGVLGQLGRDPAPLDRTREVGVFLTKVMASGDAAPADKIEALDQIFQIFGDETLACDKEVFWKDGLLKHLEDAAPRFKAMVKTVDKRTQTELRTKAEEAMLNLGRLIKYKKKHMPKGELG